MWSDLFQLCNLYPVFYSSIILESQNMSFDTNREISVFLIFWQSGDLEKSYFGVDCLHFSVHGHAAAALALWKNMV